jgi:hypothetical protein
MGNTFGGEHHRPSNPQRGHSRRQLEDWASFDNQPVTGPGCLLIACLTILAAVATVLGAALS